MGMPHHGAVKRTLRCSRWQTRARAGKHIWRDRLGRGAERRGPRIQALAPRV
jgi:hypothetical protein